MERKLEFSIGEFYHAYNRGGNKSVIFLDDKDRERFQKLLFICNGTKPVIFKTIQGLPLDKVNRGETLVDIGAYCLMPNHFHLLLKEKIEKGISLFMSKLLTSYSMYFNKKYERTGPVFESRFKATHLNEDKYLKYIFSYIHLNPIKIIDPLWKENGITDLQKSKIYLLDYKYSSYGDYMGLEREWKCILNISEFPEYFLNFREFENYIDEWLKYPRADLG